MTIAFATAQSDDSLEYKIKAAYLYNFTKFIQWPDKSNAAFTICIVGSDPFSDLIDELETKQAFGKPIHIQRISVLNTAGTCDIAYVDKTGALPKSGLNNVLTVSSDSEFAESGGMIGFVVENQKIKLHINLPVMKRSGLEISAKLLEVATVIRESGRE